MIKYQGTIRHIPQWAEEALEAILHLCGLPDCVITSTTRTPEDQARIMFENCEKYGVKKQKELYAISGQKVLDVYSGCEGRDFSTVALQALMAAKIKEIGAQKVSKHCVTDPLLSVFDVAPSSIPVDKHESFERYVEYCSLKVNFYKPPKDPAYHIEMQAKA